MTETAASSRFAAVRAVIEAEQSAAPPKRALEMAAAIRTRHGDCVKGFVFYGSGLREADNPEKMLDYYVLVDRYRSVHRGIGLKAISSFALPPSVHYLGTTDSDGQSMSSKYAIMSLRAFVRRASGGAREPMIWGRFSQPCLVMSCDSEEVRGALIDAIAASVLHFADKVRPLMDGQVTPRDFWTRALAESYRTELRAERPLERSREIVDRFGERYDALGAAALGPLGLDGKIDLGPPQGLPRRATQLSWALRRLVGKPATAFRVLKAGFTFDGGLDYVLHKLKSHSGVTIPVTDHQRRHPLLWSPVLAWRLWRRGAFR
ncbi:MAG: hypothetical protein AAF950_11460 [Pseudomonadota bacterium]